MIGLFVLYLNVEFPYGIYFILALFLILYSFQFFNYYKLRTEIKQTEVVEIPKRHIDTPSYVVISILAWALIIGVFAYLISNNIININFINYKNDEVIFFIVFPVGLVSSILFSDYSGKFYITKNGLQSGFKYSDNLLWSKINNIIVDNDKANIRLQNKNKVLLKMKISEKYFAENIEKIMAELKERVKEL